MKAIIFTKDRPMQFRACVESLKYYANQDIPVIAVANYRDEYEDIREEFTDISWYEDNAVGFASAFKEALLESRSELIFYITDDVIFTGYMDMYEVEEVLSDPAVMGYSFRLGTNIKGFNLIQGDVYKNSILYKWRGKDSHWGYPFDLTASVYRRKDCLEMLGSSPRIPNDLEVIGCQVLSSMGKDYNAFHFGLSVGYSQDLNRVQDLYNAPVFGSYMHETERLIEQYKEGYRLDWQQAEGYAGEDSFSRTALWKLTK